MSNIEKYGWVNAARGYAILLVVMVHVPQFLFDATTLSWLAHTGDMGVQLFFIMSSFTLFNSYHKRSREDGANTKRAFFVRRLFRIAPQYWLAAIFYAALYALYFHSRINGWYLLANMAFVNGLYLPAIVYIPPGGWSIGVEMAFYLTIPLLFRTTKSIRSAILLLVLAIAASNVVNYAEYLYVKGHPAWDWDTVRGYELYFWFPNQFPVFCFGILLYYICSATRIGVRTGRLLLLGSLIAFAGLCFVPFSVDYPAYFFQKEYVYSLVFVAFAIGLQSADIPLSTSALVRNIGVTSFSIYLNHFFVLLLFKAIEKRYFAYVVAHAPALEGVVRNDLVLAAYYVATVAVAYNMSRFTYRYVELNGIRLGERLLERWGWTAPASCA